MSNVPWPFWGLAAFLALSFVVGLTTEALVVGTDFVSLLEWGATGLVLFGGGYGLLRWISQKRRSLEERWAEDMAEQEMDPSDA